MSHIIVGGQQVSISHLAPAILSCPSEAFGRDILIEIEYSNHCYTSDFVPGLHQPADIVVRERHRVARVFDAIRHELSIGLPSLMETLPSSKVYMTAVQRNYIFSTVVTLPVGNVAATYQVFFTLRRAAPGAGHDLRLFVESAYPLDGPPMKAKRPSSIRFAILALKVARGEAVRFSPR